MFTTTELKSIIKDALNDYRKAVAMNDENTIEQTINEMENVYIMVCNRNVPGSELLRKTILEARERG